MRNISKGVETYCIFDQHGRYTGENCYASSAEEALSVAKAMGWQCPMVMRELEWRNVR